MEVTAEIVKELREKTGAGIMDCKLALAESGGNIEKAIDLLRQKGLSAAVKKSTRVATEGLIGSYIHMGRIGVLVEVNCETDFVARTVDFQELVKDLSMHIAAANPIYLKREDAPQEVIDREKDIYRAQARESGKPDSVIEKIVSGKLEKFFNETCLMEQIFVKDPEEKMKIEDLIKQNIVKLGENIVIRRFVRLQLGESSR
ncbi:MAG: translation elongation factor Ts [Nitrospirae bacterium]|nr:translation elongation factor Ts [Nitrospirota bacterium]